MLKSQHRAHTYYSCAIQPHAKDEAVEPKWKQVWQLAVRSVSMTTTCRAACLLLNSMLKGQLLPHHAVADDINNMVTMADICGPVALLDCSLVFMNSLANVRNELAPSAVQITSSSIIRWVFSTWKPGRSHVFQSLFSGLSFSTNSFKRRQPMLCHMPSTWSRSIW